MHKYYIDIPTTNYVYFKLLDKSDKVIENCPNYPCYGSIAHGFNTKATKIHVYHEKTKVPYNTDCIKRWIADLNEMGFPCSFIEDELPDDTVKQTRHCKDTVNDGLSNMALLIMRHGQQPDPGPNSFHNFYVDLNQYENKNHLFSTLSLIRCLTETGICKVPEVYFGLMDAEPQRDKLDACQASHKIVSSKEKKYDPMSYANTGHMVTYDGNGKNIAKEKLMERFKKEKIDLRDRGHLTINSNWNGNNG